MSCHGRKPKAISATTVATVSSVGTRKLRLMLSTEVLRQASSGPSAVSSKSNIAIGISTRLKNGAPTVTFVPCTHSDSSGKNVPQSTVKQAASSKRLLNRKLDSRETSDSSLCSLFRCSPLRAKKKVHVASVTIINTTNQLPMDDCANACTELTIPLRVRNVPSIESRNVEKISHMFQTFSMPR